MLDTTNGQISQMSDDQVVAMGLFMDWIRSGRQEFRLGGLAGTGKTSMIRHMIDVLTVHLGVVPDVITPTAKAAEVLNRKGVTAGTAHSLLCDFQYEHVVDGRVEPVFSDKDVSRPVVICDEASMVTSEMRKKILRCGGRVVWVADFQVFLPT